MAVGKSSINRVSKAADKQVVEIPIEEVQHETSEPVEVEVVKSKAVVKKTSTSKNVKKNVKEVAIVKDVKKISTNCHLGDQMPIHLL